MKRKRTLLAQNYREALRRHLEAGAASDLTAAHKIGECAVQLGLETLDLARIHEEALLEVMLPHHTARASEGVVRRCVAFFAEAAQPVEETHRGTREANHHLKVLLETLTERTMELANSNRELNEEIARRRQVEGSLRISESTTSQLLKKSHQMQEELRHLSRRLLVAQEDERRRISRDLHDVIAQTLTGINLRLAEFTSQTRAGAKDLHQRIAAAQALVEKSVEIVHRFARDLRPPLLDDLGLIPALTSHLQDFMEQNGIRVALEAYAGVEKLSSETRTVVFRVVQEALVNVGKHSQASQVRVSIRDDKHTVSLEIHDNGRGFAVKDASSAGANKRLGLLGMRERVEMVGGSFAVESTPGEQTTLRIHIPFRANHSGIKAFNGSRVPHATHTS